MKRLLLTLAAAAIMIPAIADTTVDFGVIGRLDANPCFYFDGSKPEYYSGNSVLYTDLECAFGDHVALTWIGHWLNTAGMQKPFEATRYLYENTWTSLSNFTDFAYLDVYAGNWTFRLGKDVVAMGGFEFDPYDWDCTFETVSMFWNCFNCYQWGGSVNWMTPSEKSNFMLQAVSATAINGEVWKPWQNGYGLYSFKYTGEYGLVETSNSYGWMQTAGGAQKSGIEMLTLGLRFNLGTDVKLGFEWQNRRDTAIKLNKASDFFNQSYKALASLTWVASDKVDLAFIAGYEKLDLENETFWLVDYGYLDEPAKATYCFGGATVSYYPLRNSHDLRIQATVAGNKYIGKGISTTLGITWNHVFHIVK